MKNSTKSEKKGAFALKPSLARLVAAKRLTAQCVLLFEQVLPLTLPILSVVALYLAASWFGVFRIVPDWLRIVLLFGFGLGLLATLYPFRKLHWPGSAAADRLLEERNGLPHQPVAVQEDEPAFDTPFARALWREHQTRMAEKIASLDAGFPQPDIASHDRWALRAIPALLIVVAFGYSLSTNGGSISDALQPRPQAQATDPAVRIDAWITPPAYTGRAPVYLTATGSEQGAIKIPQSSNLTVRVSGGKADEKVVFAREDGQRIEIAAAENPAATPNAPASETPATPAPATAEGQQPATATPQQQTASTHLMKLEENGTLEVNGRKWAFDVIPDKAPEIAFNGLPKPTVNGALEIGYTIKDDYGVQEATAEIVPVETDTSATPLYPLPEYKLDIPRRNARDAKGVASKNLTEHPLAGKRVRITLIAKDAAGQTGRSPPHEMTLPARPFSEPLAAAVAEQRQTFALDTRKMPEAIALNEALTLRPEETIPNLTNYLLIESARQRMKLAKGDEALKDTADYLWDIAIGMEDGNLSQAERNLRNAQQNLADALQRNAPDAEVKKLMDELRKAMQDYMKELAQRMQNAPMQPNQNAQNVIRQQDLERMMDQIENLARSGNRDAAQQMLSELQRMMNNMQAGRPQRGQQQQGQDNSQMRQQMDKLGQILRDQQKLMEETFKLDQQLKDRMQRGDPNNMNPDLGMNDPLLNDMPMDNDGMPQDQQQQQGQQGQNQQGQQQQGQQGQQGQNPSDEMTAEQLREALKQLRERQDQLGKQLGEMQKSLGDMGMKPGQGFGQAQREMEGAGRELGQGRGEPAIQGQGRALEALRQGARDMMNQMMRAQQGQQGQGQGPQGQVGQGNQNGRDPLGRPRRADGPDFGDQVKVPDEIDVQRAREILDAIREKLGNNPSQEMERRYLERLLDIQ
ncbi:TIGR02302 family protein [Rhizobium sp. S163]|uniref:TIGR02302 family protein n=1 Tax=Rhizobium sp. S163 TaxID=3055039 RepID=UPI0025A9AD3D|nr:TIGR02302 family protein [Rhizobium sp. S163]MDM9649555.1 TIGR02302 family protein [Rhizobium sp. S163]